MAQMLIAVFSPLPKARTARTPGVRRFSSYARPQDHACPCRIGVNVDLQSTSKQRDLIETVTKSSIGETRICLAAKYSAIILDDRVSRRILYAMSDVCPRHVRVNAGGQAVVGHIEAGRKDAQEDRT